MESILQDINGVIGVMGSFVCNGDGTLLAHDLPSVPDETILEPAARTVLRTIEKLQRAKGRRLRELDLAYFGGRIIVKNLRVGCLFLLCARNINVPLLDLTANAAGKQLAKTLQEMQPAAPTAPPSMVEEEVLVEEKVPAQATGLLLTLAREAVTAAQGRGVFLRLLGGMAVKEVCPSAHRITLPPDGLDLDFAVYGRQRRELEHVLESQGYEPHRRFNAFHGQRRLKYDKPDDGVALDIFVDTFHMCHRLPFAGRLELHDFTMPLADLLLSKLQVVQMGEKDLRDIYVILHDHELAREGAVDEVDVDYIASICSDDWGWYKTVTMNIERSVGLVDDFLSGQEKEIYLSRVGRLRQRIEAAPKSLRWQARARIGEARRWYDLPEE